MKLVYHQSNDPSDESTREYAYDGDLRLLFGLYLGVWSLGNGLIPLFPLRTIALGLSLSDSGLLLAALYCSLVISSLISPRIIASAGSTKRTLTACLIIRTLAFPVLSCQSIHLLTVAGVICWLCFGLELCALKVHANSIVPPKARGAKLGIIYMKSPLGAVFGGGVLGVVTNTTGFQSAIYLASAITPMSIFAAVRLSNIEKEKVTTSHRRRVKLPFIILPLAALNMIANCVGLVARSATPLVMKTHGYGEGTPALASAVGGLFVLPCVPHLGALSDRRGRFFVLASGYVAATMGVLTLVFARQLWAFFLASVLASLFLYGTAGIRTAVVGDIANSANLPRATATYEAFGWFGAMLGFAATGFGLTHFGWRFLVFVSCVGVLAAMQLGVGIRSMLLRNSQEP